jgi:hypothetical protein
MDRLREENIKSKFQAEKEALSNRELNFKFQDKKQEVEAYAESLHLEISLLKT